MTTHNNNKKRSSIRKLEFSAKKGNLKSLYQLANYYQEGQYVEKDPKLADVYFNRVLNYFQKQSLKISSIKLINFRVFEEISIDFNARSQSNNHTNVVVLIGNNGAGKTSILEGVAQNLGWLTNRILREKGTAKLIPQRDISNNNVAEYSAMVTQFSVLNDLQYEIGLSTSKEGGSTPRRNSLEEISDLASLYRRANDRDTQFNMPIMAYYSVARAVEVDKRDIAIFDDSNLEETLGKFRGYYKALNGPADFKLFYRWFKNLEDISNADSKGEQGLAVEIEKLEDKIALLTKIQESTSKNDSSRDIILSQKYESQAELEKLNAQLFNEQTNSENLILMVVSKAIYKFMGEGEFNNLRIQRRPYSDMLIDKNGLTLSVLQLSQGERSLMALIADIARRFVLLNPSLENPLEGNGVVLIDEIDLHLHPKWQRRIIEQLTTTFPNCQFIITSHSPLVISDSKDILTYLIDDGELTVLPPLFGEDANSVLLKAMDTDIRNSEVNTRINDLFDLIHEARINDAKSMLAGLESDLPSNNVELIKAKLLLRKQELRREKN
jgi:predicted ATP-binding protein involved in virulence